MEQEVRRRAPEFMSAFPHDPRPVGDILQSMVYVLGFSGTIPFDILVILAAQLSDRSQVTNSFLE